jgi:hypothetical protein
MRTTVTINDDLLAQAKRAAIDRGTTLGEVLEDALRLSFEAARQAADHPIRLTTGGRGGLQPGVDINSNAALLDLMDEDNATSRPA